MGLAKNERHETSYDSKQNVVFVKLSTEFLILNPISLLQTILEFTFMNAS